MVGGFAREPPVMKRKLCKIEITLDYIGAIASPHVTA